MDEQTRIKISDLLGDTLNLASELGMKRRIIDSLQNCQEQLDQEGELSEASSGQICRQIEETLQSMEKQILGGRKDLVTCGDVTVTQEEIRQRIVDIWKKSNAWNMQRCREYQNHMVYACQRTEKEISDLGNPRVNTALLENPEVFTTRCLWKGQEFDYMAAQKAAEYIDEMSGQYVKSMNQIRGIIDSLDHGQVSLTSKDIYEKWDSKQQERIGQLKKQQEQAGSGAHLLAEFGNVHGGKMKTLVEKSKRVEKMFLLIPILLVILAVGIPVIGGLIETMTMDADEVVSSAVESELENIIEEGVEDAIGFSISAISKASILLYVAKGIALAAIYAAWALLVRKLHGKRLLGKLEDYMLHQIQAFEQEKKLEQEVSQYFVFARENTLRRFDQDFQQLFGSAFASDGQGPTDRFGELRQRWDRIRNGR